MHKVLTPQKHEVIHNNSLLQEDARSNIHLQLLILYFLIVEVDPDNLVVVYYRT